MVVKVFTYGIQPKVWRVFSISSSVNFLQLSDAIQAAMGWENKHPHEFRHGKGKRLVDVIGPVGLQDQTLGDFQDEAILTVADYIGRKRLRSRHGARRFGRRVTVDVVDEHRSASRREQRRICQAESSSCAGDHRDAPIEPQLAHAGSGAASNSGSMP